MWFPPSELGRYLSLVAAALFDAKTQLFGVWRGAEKDFLLSLLLSVCVFIFFTINRVFIKS